MKSELANDVNRKIGMQIGKILVHRAQIRSYLHLLTFDSAKCVAINSSFSLSYG